MSTPHAYAPYHIPFDGYTSPGSRRSQEEVIYSLTDRIREYEATIRELENQLKLRGNPIKLDVACKSTVLPSLPMMCYITVSHICLFFR